MNPVWVSCLHKFVRISKKAIVPLSADVSVSCTLCSLIVLLYMKVNAWL